MLLFEIEHPNRHGHKTYDRLKIKLFFVFLLTQKLEKQQQPSTFQPKAPTTGTNNSMNSANSSNNQSQSKDPFTFYDVVETSVHFNIKRFDLHIIADSDNLST